MKIMHKVVLKKLEEFSAKYSIDYLNEKYSETYNFK